MGGAGEEERSLRTSARCWRLGGIAACRTLVVPVPQGMPSVVLPSVADPHHLDADQDPACYFDADPDPACQFDADPDPACQFDAHPDPACHFDADPDPTFYSDADPDPSFQIKARNLEKAAQIGSYSIHFGSSSAN